MEARNGCAEMLLLSCTVRPICTGTAQHGGDSGPEEVRKIGTVDAIGDVIPTYKPPHVGIRSCRSFSYVSALDQHDPLPGRLPLVSHVYSVCREGRVCGTLRSTGE